MQKNTLENNQGFSPAQIVFGQNPRLPSLLTTGPPGLEEVVMSKSLANHINAMHKARECFIQCESDRTLKSALKQRIYKEADQVFPGDWVYYKNHRVWEGPVKVSFKDGKKIYAVRGNKILTINSDNVLLSKSEGEVSENSNERGNQGVGTRNSEEGRREQTNRESSVSQYTSLGHGGGSTVPENVPALLDSSQPEIVCNLETTLEENV